MKLEFVEDKEDIPLRIVLYGEPGIGKSTAAAQMEKPLFLDLEKGAARIKDRDGNKVKKLKNLNSFDAVKNTLKELKASGMKVNNIEFKTLVIDSIDWLEGLAHKKIIGTSGKDINRVNGGYGAGLRDSERIHRELLSDLESLQEETGVDIVCLAHEKVKETKDPEAIDDYEKYRLKLDDRISALWLEWCEAMFFARYEVIVSKGEDNNGTGKSRAISNDERILIVNKRAGADAKNRYDLETVMPFTPRSLRDIKSIVQQNEMNNFSEPNLSELVSEAQRLADDIQNADTKKLVLKTIEENKENETLLKQTIKRVKEINKK